MENILPSIEKEFQSARVDARVRARLRTSLSRLAKAPDVGFPRAMGTTRDTEGLYRLLRNESVSYGCLVEAHGSEAALRATPGSTVRVIHDTSEFSFGGSPGSRAGLGQLRGSEKNSGFLGHFALAVEGDESAKPLGVVGLHCWARTKPPRGRRHVSGGELAKDGNRESRRWPQVVQQAEACFAGRCSLVHIADREADSYSFLWLLVEQDARFVVRVARDRVVLSDDDEPELLSRALVTMPTVLHRKVTLSRRMAKKTPRSTHGSREEREAKLSVSAGQVRFRHPAYLRDLPECLDLNVVCVQEVDAPEDVEPVAWVLVTSEPITTADDVAAVIDHYRARWLIEEYFKALKTGCAIEKRQLESFETLTTALALFVPIAWQMLLLRAVSRAEPGAPASAVLSPAQLQVLQHLQPSMMKKDSSALGVLLAVAAVGGHLKQNGMPGWRTLAYGMQTLTSQAVIWEAGVAFGSKKAARSDQ
jgi:hypothetical protein